jgi:hypothetical protein
MQLPGDGCFDCLELRSASFDSALLMRGIPHEWRARGSPQAVVG